VVSRVNPRARTREDRAGDPLDGLVNLFDLGIVLSVAFLLAALSSLDLTSALFKEERAAAPGSVVVQPDEKSRPVDLQPGAQVVGRGQRVGTVYRLDDGREILVEPDGSSSTTTPTPGTGGTTTTPGTGGTTPDGTTTPGGGAGGGGSTGDEPTLGAPDIGTDGKP
jgi:hypothetical protein